jgi:hypothetical protein
LHCYSIQKLELHKIPNKARVFLYKFILNIYKRILKLPEAQERVIVTLEFSC